MNQGKPIQLLHEGFSLQELKRLSCDLGIPADTIGGDNTPELARRLTEYMHRHGRTDELVSLAQERRPNLDWTLLDTPEPEPFAADQSPADESTTQSSVHAEGDSATAVGDRGVHVGRDVGRDVITGDQINITLQTKTETGAPLQLPPRADHFTGRAPDLTRLTANLQPGRTETIVGTGGMGKTALVSEALWRLHESGLLLTHFPDGLIFHSFYNQPEADVALEHIARSFDVDPAGSPAQAARHAISGKTALLVLDGAEEARDLAEVLAVLGACAILITTRDLRDATGDWEPLDPLLGDEALELLREWAGEYAAEETPSRAICDLVGRLPLAVRLAGRYLKRRRQSAAAYLAWLSDTPLEALDQGKRQKDSVPLLMARSLDQVGDTACQAMSIAGLLALAPFERAAIAAALDIAENDLRRPLDELLDFGLLLPVGDDRLQPSHALVHTYARLRLDPAEGALERLTNYYRSLLEEQNALGAPGHARLDLDRPHLMALLRRLSEREAWASLLALANPVAGFQSYMDLSGRWTERIEACNLALAAAREAAERWQEAIWLNNLALAYAAVGRLPEAIGYYERTVAIAQEIEDRQLEGAALGNLGEAYRNLGQLEQAIDYYEQALVIARDFGDRRNEGAWLGNLGLAYADLGQLEQAIDYHEQSLAIQREIGDRRGEGNSLGNLGEAYRNLGQLEQAIDYYEQALAIQRDIGDRRGEGNQLGNLGLAYADLGQVEKAIDYHEEALAISRDIGDRRGEGADLGNLGIAYKNLGQLEKAIDYYEQALAIAREVGYRQGEAIHLFNIGNLLKDQGKTEQAADHYQQALTIFEAIKSPHAETARQALDSLNSE